MSCPDYSEVEQMIAIALDRSRDSANAIMNYKLRALACEVEVLADGISPSSFIKDVFEKLAIEIRSIANE